MKYCYIQNKKQNKRSTNGFRFDVIKGNKKRKNNEEKFFRNAGRRKLYSR